ncbi:swarming motility protein [Citromicrobium phage vB_CbaS-RXM]|nr:swarming motility protein [Citromicrobium phage vB_CbaS-RXM]
MSDDNLIYGFQGRYRFLSNFHPVRRGVYLDGFRYPTVEHAYQAAKTLCPVERAEICHAKTPGEAKRLGREVTIRENWAVHRLCSMEGLLRQKFAPRTYLAGQLKNTGTKKIVEGNTWGDTFWGRCNGKGHNHLGELLMEIRQDLITNYTTGSR